ncbi:MAG: EsaB/YukD family protein [Oscillospiraceae bacterium]|nr:EsaB/YukD family protein [Oscillospiraceae bacterium]
MSKVIITLEDEKKSFSYDLELPTNLEYEKLIDDIVQTIISYNPDLMYQTNEVRLMIPKLNMAAMRDGETLEQLGVLNGDYLIIR